MGYVSSSTEKVLGYRPAELVGSAPIDIVHPDDLTIVLETLAQVWETPGLHPSFCYRARHKDGSWRYLEASANNMLDDPEMEGIVFVGRDTTDRVEAQEEIQRLNEKLEERVRRRTVELEATLSRLRESERALGDALSMLQVTFDRAPAGIGKLDPQGCWLSVNERMCGITGYSRAELAGASFLDAAHPEDTGAEAGNLQTLVSGEGETYSTELRYRPRDGSYFWANMSVSVVRGSDDSPCYLIAVIEGISERKEGELVLKRLTPREREVVDLLAESQTNSEASRREVAG